MCPDGEDDPIVTSVFYDILFQLFSAMIFWINNDQCFTKVDRLCCRTDMSTSTYDIGGKGEEEQGQ